MLGVRKLDVILLNLFVVIFEAAAVDKCTPQTTCKCAYDDGRIIDVTPLAKEEFLQGTKENITYYFHPCGNKKLTIPNVGNITQACANTEVSLCMYNRTDNSIQPVGKNEEAHIVPSLTDHGLYEIIFLNKSNKSIIITLACTNLEDSNLVVEQVPKHHDLILYSHFACAHMVAHGLSTGSVLIIIFLTFSAIYLVCGVAILHFLRGAQGKEMIPNIDFWSDLPLLVRDGMVFLQNGCKPPQQPGDTYDRI